MHNVRNPKISVIVTTFNRKEALANTLRSILAQTFTDTEIIVVDNFSDYDFVSFIYSFEDSRVKGFQNDNSGIIAVNRNFGISKASGEYLAFCDDDDSWILNKLEKQIQYISEHSLENKPVVIYTNCLNVSRSQTIKTSKKDIRAISDFLYGNQITFSSALVSNFNPKHQFNELPEFYAVEDYLLWCSLKLDGYEFFLLREYLVNYYVSDSSASMKNYGLNHLRSILVLVVVGIKTKGTKLNLAHLIFSVVIHCIKFSIKNILKNIR